MPGLLLDDMSMHRGRSAEEGIAGTIGSGRVDQGLPSS